MYLYEKNIEDPSTVLSEDEIRQLKATPFDGKLIANAVDKGLSIIDIARLTGKGSGAISISYEPFRPRPAPAPRIKEDKEQKNKKRIADVLKLTGRWDEIEKLRDGGAKFKEIAKIYGISEARAQQIYKHAIKYRPQNQLYGISRGTGAILSSAGIRTKGAFITAVKEGFLPGAVCGYGIKRHKEACAWAGIEPDSESYVIDGLSVKASWVLKENWILTPADLLDFVILRNALLRQKILVKNYNRLVHAELCRWLVAGKKFSYCRYIP